MRRIRLQKDDGRFTKWFPYNPESFERIFNAYNSIFVHYETSFALSTLEHAKINNYIKATQS